MKKYSLFVPDTIGLFYTKEKKILTIIGPKKIKSLKLDIDLKICKKQQKIEISFDSISSYISNSDRKKLRLLEGITLAIIRQSLLETCYLVHKKLKFVGVGYRVFDDIEPFEKKSLLLRLGFSHPIFLPISTNIKIRCFKRTKVVICGFSYSYISQFASLVRSFKKPEPYKGKGILYFNETISLKEGKKI